MRLQRNSRGDGRPCPSGGAKLRKKLAEVVAIALVALVLMAAGDTAARFDRIGHKMMCTCGCNQILLECNHVGCPASDSMRDELTTALTRGDSDDLVLQAFVQKYGTTVIAAPTTSGFNLVAWVMPFAALLAGTGLAVAFVRRWQRRQAPIEAGVLPRGAAQVDALRQRARQETEW